jgi:DNA-binding XRE family transcriptional regulator
MRNPIEQLREKVGLEVEDFARRLDVSPTTVRLLEKGLLRRSRVVWTALEAAFGYDARALSKKHEMWLRLRTKQSGSNPAATQAS